MSNTKSQSLADAVVYRPIRDCNACVTQTDDGTVETDPCDYHDPTEEL